jgi:Asp-tRNA(Asn)/Glu-tRNA(Gln) amidotransferase A subunit family amidase
MSGSLASPQSLPEMYHRIDAGQTNLAEELTCMLDRITSVEKRVHALLPDESPASRKKRVLEEAHELEERFPDPATRPPLWGALVGVKDIFHTDGFPIRGGSKLPEESFLEEGAPGLPGDGGREGEVIRAVRAAGGIILGKTVSTEFAYFAPGPTRNPWNPDHTPGGSSSGSAAAVAAGMCHIALGTQTIGSITRPASFCGVAGYKPSYGRVSTDGVIPFSHDADHIGPIASEVRTLAAAAAAMVPDWQPLPDASVPRVGGTSAVPAHPDLKHAIGPVLVPDDAYLVQADEAGRAAIDALVERLTGLGVKVERIAVFDDIDEINAAHRAMVARDFAEVHAHWIERYGELYSPQSRDLIKAGLAVSDDARARFREGRRSVRERLEQALERHGARMWISPASVGEAPKGISATGDPIMNLPWTYSGLPTVSLSLNGIPRGMGPTGLPLGVQCAGRFGEDEVLFAQTIVMSDLLRPAILR